MHIKKRPTPVVILKETSKNYRGTTKQKAKLAIGWKRGLKNHPFLKDREPLSVKEIAFNLKVGFINI